MKRQVKRVGEKMLLFNRFSSSSVHFQVIIRTGYAAGSNRILKEIKEGLKHNVNLLSF